MRLVFASFLLSGCVLLRAGDCGGSAQGGGGSAGAVNSGGLGGGGGGGVGGTGAGGQTCKAACEDTARCECADYVPEGQDSDFCGEQVVQLEDVMRLGSIAVSGDQVAWAFVRDGETLIGRRSASLGDSAWAESPGPDSIVAVGADAPLGRLSPIEGGGFFYRPANEMTEGFLCWPGEDCEPAPSGLKILDLRVQSGRLAIAAESWFCFTQLPGEPRNTLKDALFGLPGQSTSACQVVPFDRDAPTAAVQVQFTDSGASSVWLTARQDMGPGKIFLVDALGAMLANPIGVNVRNSAASVECGATARSLLMKQCSSPQMCTLDQLLAGETEPKQVPLAPGVLQPDGQSVIAADRDYFYYSSPGNINIFGRPSTDTRQLALTGSNATVISIDASHEDYLYFTYSDNLTNEPTKFFLSRWHKQKLTPATATP